MAFTEPTIHGVLSVKASTSSVNPCVMLRFKQTASNGTGLFGTQSEFKIFMEDFDLAARIAAAINSVNAKVEEEA